MQSYTSPYDSFEVEIVGTQVVSAEVIRILKNERIDRDLSTTRRDNACASGNSYFRAILPRGNAARA
jgi:hypothetical protein